MEENSYDDNGNVLIILFYNIDRPGYPIINIDSPHLTYALNNATIENVVYSMINRLFRRVIPQPTADNDVYMQIKEQLSQDLQHTLRRNCLTDNFEWVNELPNDFKGEFITAFKRFLSIDTEIGQKKYFNREKRDRWDEIKQAMLYLQIIKLLPPMEDLDPDKIIELKNLENILHRIERHRTRPLAGGSTTTDADLIRAKKDLQCYANSITTESLVVDIDLNRIIQKYRDFRLSKYNTLISNIIRIREKYLDTKDINQVKADLSKDNITTELMTRANTVSNDSGSKGNALAKLQEAIHHTNLALQQESSRPSASGAARVVTLSLPLPPAPPPASVRAASGAALPTQVVAPALPASDVAPAQRVVTGARQGSQGSNTSPPLSQRRTLRRSASASAIPLGSTEPLRENRPLNEPLVQQELGLTQQELGLTRLRQEQQAKARQEAARDAELQHQIAEQAAYIQKLTNDHDTARAEIQNNIHLIREQTATIDSQRTELDGLRSRTHEQQSRIDELNAQLQQMGVNNNKMQIRINQFEDSGSSRHQQDSENLTANFRTRIATAEALAQTQLAEITRLTALVEAANTRVETANTLAERAPPRETQVVRVAPSASASTPVAAPADPDPAPAALQSQGYPILIVNPTRPLAQAPAPAGASHRSLGRPNSPLHTRRLNNDAMKYMKYKQKYILLKNIISRI